METMKEAIRQPEPQKIPYREDCLFCGGTALKTEAVFWKGNAFSSCRGCGLIFQDPPTTDTSNRTFYEKDYYADLKSLTPAIQAARGPIYEEVLDLSRGYRKTGRLLDVGSGYGDFLIPAKERGWEVWGIDPSKEACAAAREKIGPCVLDLTVEDASFPENHFDVVTLWNVVDCLPDPVNTMQKVKTWLRPGGLLVIRTPNAGFQYAVYKTYTGLKPLLNRLGWKKEASVFLRANFRGKTIKRFLDACGYDAIRVANGRPTSGDPYQVGARPGIIGFAKRAVFFISNLVALLTGSRVLTNSTLLVLASKESVGMKRAARKLRFRIIAKRWVLTILACLGYLLLLPLWKKWLGAKRTVTCLLYHSVSDVSPSDMSVRGNQFEQQMSFLKENCECIPLADALERLDGAKQAQSTKRAVSVTFDDGYADNYHNALPVLSQLGIPATIFLLAGKDDTERKTLHLASDDNHPSELLSWEQVKEMSQRGISFGSHGESHQQLAKMTEEELRSEIHTSREALICITGLPIDYFSYPYGTAQDFDQRAMDMAKAAGYKAGFSAIYGKCSQDQDRFALRRINIEASDTLFTLRAKLNGALAVVSWFHAGPVRRLIRSFDALFLRTPPKTKSALDKVLLVSVDFPPHTDGVSTIAKQMSERIAKRASGLCIMGPKDAGDREYDARHNYKAYRLPGYHWGYLRILPMLLAMPYALLREGIRKVYALNIGYGGLIAWAMSHVLKLDYVLFAYGYEFEKVKASPFMRRLYLRIYARSKHVITCSENVKTRLTDFGVPAEKITNLYPAVDLEKYRVVNVPGEFIEKHGLKSKRVLLTVGRLVKRKGHDYVIRAVANLLKDYPDLVYCIVGIGQDAERLHALVAELGLKENVKFMGKLPEEDLIYMYNLCDVFLMPSREIEAGGHIEGFGIVFLEANACGKPVIGGNSGGVVEAVRDGETGLLADPHSQEDIEAKLRYLLERPDEIERMGAEGLRIVQECFNWDGYVQAAYKILCERAL